MMPNFWPEKVVRNRSDPSYKIPGRGQDRGATPLMDWAKNSLQAQLKARADRRRFEEFAVNPLQFVALIFAQYEDVPASPDVHVRARRLELVGTVGAQHFDLQFVAELADVAGHYAHVVARF